MSTLYIVATPIGNLKDITLRAIEVLRDVDYVLAEDSRVSKVLLDSLSLQKPTISYKSRATKAVHDKVIRLLEEGKNLALISDAGTPGIQDPGTYLVALTLKHFGDKVPIVPIPGASALTTALSVAGIPVNEFTFLGFLPHKKGRETLLKRISKNDTTYVFYESPHRFLKMLDGLAKFEFSGTLIIFRELTKKFEEIKRGTVQEIKHYYDTHGDKMRGEFVIIAHTG